MTSFTGARRTGARHTRCSLLLRFHLRPICHEYPPTLSLLHTPPSYLSVAASLSPTHLPLHQFVTLLTIISWTDATPKTRSARRLTSARTHESASWDVAEMTEVKCKETNGTRPAQQRHGCSDLIPARRLLKGPDVEKDSGAVSVYLLLCYLLPGWRLAST